ncbi:MAG TPA: FCD domain-containing protein [Stellaceae bacterium]|nr:FCD domain-containing protein [Stellaceae bacterium]
MSESFPYASASQTRRARARRLVDQLRAVLERHIDEGRLRPGERLATERELARQFGASRNVVRAVLAELDKVGKITRHVGRGTFVRAPARNDAAPLADASPAELMEFRLALEPGLADAIVLHASDGDLRELMHCVEEGDAARRWEEFEHWDRRFHQLLVAATHNRLIVGLYEAVRAVRQNAAWGRIKRQSTDPAKWKKYQEEHRRIAEALIARDTETAKRAIRGHLRGVRAKMLDH